MKSIPVPVHLYSPLLTTLNSLDENPRNGKGSSE